MEDGLLREQEQEAEVQFEKALENIGKEGTSKTLDLIYFFPKQFVKMVANGYSNGMIIFGENSLGKSYVVLNSFSEDKIPFIYHRGHITTLELYQFLYKHRKENIVFDDVDILDNIINLNMFKSCLDSDMRVVCYSTSSDKLKVPNRFIFQGTIIIILNKKPSKNADLSAVEGRVINYELSMDYKTKVKVMFELAQQKYKDITKDDRMIIINWIKDNTTEVTENFNLRTMFLIFEMFRFDKVNWKGMAKHILIEDEEMRAILNGMDWKDWCEEFGKGRATFFRYKKRLSSIKVSSKIHIPPLFRSPLKITNTQIKTKVGGKMKMAKDEDKEEDDKDEDEDNEEQDED